MTTTKKAAIGRLKAGFFGGTTQTEATPRQVYQEALIWRLRQLLGEAMSGGTDRELIAVLNSLVTNRDSIERAIVAWVDLIEVLVQDAEQRYGSQPHRGSLKSADVRAVMRYLLRPGRLTLELPHVPPELEPFVTEVIVQWSVDAVVEVANSYGLWVDMQPEQQLTGLGRWLAQTFAPVLRGVGNLALWAWERLYPPPTLSPALRSAVEAVERESLIAQQPAVITSIGAAFTWIGQHRTNIVAAVQLVAAVVNEAETFANLSGAEKKAYAHDLVFAVLEEAGLHVPDGLLRAKLSAIVSAAIEALVHVFNKRNKFTHRSAALP
ncbi:MAG TPA: hypothetical protein VF937_07765 [Chloroflexota bacterium]